MTTAETLTAKAQRIARSQPTECPRCGGEFDSDQEFYGPCGACRDALRDGTAVTETLGDVEYPPRHGQNRVQSPVSSDSQPSGSGVGGAVVVEDTEERPPEQSGGRSAFQPTKRSRRSQLEERPAVFVRWDGQSPDQLVALAHDNNAARVFLIGDDRGIGELRPWAGAGDGNHWLKLPNPVCRFDGIEVARADAWFGSLDITPDDAQRARAELLDMIRSVKPWRTAVLFLTPSATGHDLLLRSLPRSRAYPDGYPKLDAETADWLRGITCQHRNQLLPEPYDVGDAPVDVAEYDKRLAYLATCRYAMPIAPAAMTVNGDTPAGMVGWRHAEIAAPDGWRHVGLLPVKSDDGVGWGFPTAGTHGGWFHTRELQLAARHGWHIRYTGDSFLGKSADPLKPWAEHLWKLYLRTDGHVRAVPLRRMIRSLALGAIGALHGARGVITRYVDGDTEIPDDVTGLHFADGDTVGYHERFDKAGHPEWTGTTWAACRYSIAETAMAVPHHCLVGLRTDAVHVAETTTHAGATRFVPEDKGRLGDFRKKATTRSQGWPSTL